MSKKLKTRPCDRATARERLGSAVSYFGLAETASDLSEFDDPYRWSSQTSSYVLAGIAAADAICCATLAEHSQGDDHRQAVVLLSRVSAGGKDLANDLSVLLGMKTVAGYGSAPLSEERAKRAKRSAARLVQAAQERVVG